MLRSVRPRFPTAGPRYSTPVRPVPIWASGCALFLTSSIAVMMLICSQAIWLLEAASLSKGTNKDFFGNTASTGAGLWCGFFFFLAAFSILAMNWVSHIHRWGITSVVLTVIAWCFSAILIGLDAKAVKDGRKLTDSLTPKAKILAAQLALACCVNVLCILFIFIYTVIRLRARSRMNQEKLRRYPF